MVNKRKRSKKSVVRPPKSEKEIGKTVKKKVKEEYFDALNEERMADETEKIHFIKSSFHLSFMEHFFQKFYDKQIWKVIIGSFFCSLFLGFNWHIIAIISFSALLGNYSQRKSRDKNNAIEYTSRMLSKDPDRLQQFLALTSAPKNLRSGKSGDAPCEWINDIIIKFWPHINSIAQVEIDKKGFSKQGLDIGNGIKIYFERFTLGDKPPALTSIHVRQTGHRKDEIVLVLKLIYFGNCLVLFSYKTKVFLKVKAGVKDIYFRGIAVIVLRPLLEVPPFIGGISFCLEDVPIIDYNGINLANIADNKFFKNFILGILKGYLVSPNKIFVPLLNNANIKRELKFPLPIGMALIQIIEAEDLPIMDPNRCLVMTGSSDSFCKLKIGDLRFETSIIYANINPYFGDCFSAPIHDFNDYLKIEVFDKDAISADDLMGAIEFKISDIGRNKHLNGRDKWLPIGKSPTGSIHLRIAIFELSCNKKNIQRIEMALKESSVKYPMGVLSVYIYYVSRISTVDEELDFKPMVKLRFSDQIFQTKTSKPPKRGYYYFEEYSHFLVNNFRTEFLEVSVVCQEMKTLTISKVFGECNIAIKDLINSTVDMTLNQNFPIKKILRLKDATEVKNTGVIRMFLSLKVCKFRQKLMDNLKIAPNIQANIEQTTENKTSFTKLCREPVSSVMHPIRSLRLIASRVSLFGPQPKTIVAEDISKIPRYLSKGLGCWLKVRVKWPDRKTLHIEVLKLIGIPLEIVDRNFKYSIAVALNIKQKGLDKSFANVMRKRIGLTTDIAKANSRRLQKKMTNKHSIINYVNDISFNERLIFKISSTNNFDDHILEFFLILYQPRKYFASNYDSRTAASSLPTDIPRVEFKGDPIEYWSRINLYEKYKQKLT